MLSYKERYDKFKEILFYGKDFEFKIFDETTFGNESQVLHLACLCSPFREHEIYLWGSDRDLFLKTIRVLFEIRQNPVYLKIKEKLYKHLTHQSDEMKYLNCLPISTIRKAFLFMNFQEYKDIGYKRYLEFEKELSINENHDWHNVDNQDKMDEKIGFYIIKSRTLDFPCENERNRRYKK